MSIPTRQRLVEAAVRRFYRDGFRSVGIDQVLADVGISKTAFYKHFDSKEDLMLAALEMQNAWLQDTFVTMIRERGGDSPIDQLHAVLDVVDYIIASDDFQGCIFVNAAMEFPLPHEPAHVAAAENKKAIEELLHTLAVEAAADNPRELAQELCLIMEGTYVTRHVTGNERTIDIARRLANLLIEAHCQQSGTAND
ncbi:TetR/AcrR family transcriptional regulator [Aeoliella sp. ICT_H6.2]|uniref:TetR/AcrR family transcriptional regulator n=1 Tax=Aeoliella straminimaris TaxID=2954799 RepID=A0A9X2JG77_9BACT|nr:TetR/AcrR family transcriptional regulator [Aeoliella straminimaris]MCO6044471.1 TetR/AcrR family transcriptional regulator [Aeoliella straminimaris]